MAVRTWEPKLSRVMEHVVLELGPLDKGHAALLALVRLLAGVRLNVAVQRLFGRELYMAL